MKMIKKYWFIIIFALTLMVPLYGGFLERNIVLSGVTASPEVVEITEETLGNGTYQTYLNDLWENNFPGKKILLNVRNQLLFSFCGISPNSNVVVGKDGYLYEPGYILAELQVEAPGTDEYFDNLSENLIALDALLNENDKELYIFITPTKAYFCDDYFPTRYELLSGKENYTETNYSKFLEMLEGTELSYFDSIQYIEENLDTEAIQSPIFWKSGIHWSHFWGGSAAGEFLSFMDENSKYDLSAVEVTETKSDLPTYPDTDLYDSLNLLDKVPNEDWYSATMNVVQNGEDYPNIFLRGGSFMGQSLSSLIRCGVFGEDVHFENNYYFLNKYAEAYYLSGYSAYDEMDLDTLVGKSDILVLEINEAQICNMSWGFIEYLLEHPEYLDYNY